MSVQQLNQTIAGIESENIHLKKKLLGLINDYKILKQCLQNDQIDEIRSPSFDNHLSRKRSFQEDLDDAETLVSPHSEDEKSTEVLGLLLNDVEEELPSDLLDMDEFDDMDSPLLSRTTSPIEDADNSLMTSLTRSTTVSTNNSFLEKPHTRPHFELPKFNTNKYEFQFDPSFSTKLHQDKYNMINDFLEEKLIDNDLTYYENLNSEA